MKEYLKNNKLYYIGEGIFISCWFIYYIFFLKFYTEAFFYVDKKAKWVVQILFTTTYYSSEVLLYSMIAFILMTLNLLLFLLFYIENKRKNRVERKTNISLIVFLTAYSLIQIPFFTIIIWPILLIIIIFSLTVNFIIFAITKYLYEEKEVTFDENDMFQVEGPFETHVEAENYAKDVLSSEHPNLESKQLDLEYEIFQDEQNKFFLGFSIIPIREE